MHVIERLETLSPILCSIPVAAGMIGRSERVIYTLIGTGKLRAVKSDGRTLVVVESVRAYAAGLPPAQIAAPIDRPPVRMRQSA